MNRLSLNTIFTLAILVILITAGYFSVSWLPPTTVLPAACTLEAKLCPDGSAVGRAGPGCEFAPCPNGDWRFYHNNSQNFSINYPPDFTVNEQYVYTNLGPGREIKGVSFTIPALTAAGTNLSADSYISVESLAPRADCTTDLFLDGVQSVSPVTDSGVTYQMSYTNGAAAGNFYEETVYLLPGSNCTVIRYFIHSTNIGNYEPGAVAEFDRAGVRRLLDNIRRSYQATVK